MNKISKKIVALVTMAAFVLTLVPAAAFAADTRSSVQTAKENMTVTMPATDNAKAEAEVTLSVSEADANHNVLFVQLVIKDLREICQLQKFSVKYILQIEFLK